VRTKPSLSAARINSFALAAMDNSELDVVGELSATVGEFLGNHVKNVLKLALRLLWRGPNRMAALDGWNVRDITAVVIAAANDLIVEQRLHSRNTSANGLSIKAKLLPTGLTSYDSRGQPRILYRRWRGQFLDNRVNSKPITGRLL